jgi:uncharacterized protein YcbK (DUF882 family)
MLEFIRKIIELLFGGRTAEENAVVEITPNLETEKEEKVYMISMKEILKNVKLEDTPAEHQANLAILLEKINKIRDLWGKPMTVTSGYRSKEDQIRVYAAKGITDISKIPMGSQHLRGAAVDIFDPKQEMQAWVLNNVNILEEVGLWMEDFSATKNWLHFQIFPPRSGKRFFMP